MEFRVLGPLEVRLDGEAVPLGGPRQRALLAMLLLNAGRVVSRDRLTDELWGPDTAATAGHALNVAVARLRKALEDGGPTRLVTRPPGYVLRVEPGELDLDTFDALASAGRLAAASGDDAGAAEHLRSAEALWRGRPLADLELEPFARLDVERLEERRLSVVEARIDAELALGHHHALAAELRQLTDDHPLRERLREQLMLALYRCGRQAEALAAYRSGRALLVEEQGLDPGPRLRELQQSILRQDPALDPAPRPPRPNEAADRRPPRTGPIEAASHRTGRRRMAVAGAFLALAAVIAGATGLASRDTSAERPQRIDDNAVAIVDLGSGREVAPGPLRSRPTAAAVGAGSFWLTASDAGTVSRVDPATGAVTQTIAVGDGPGGVAVGGGAVWVANGLDATVSRIDPTTERVVQTIAVGDGPAAVAVSRDAVWVANALGSSVSRLALDTGAVMSTRSIGSRPSDLAIGAGAVWVASERENRVLRLDPTSGRVQQSIPVGTGPRAITVGQGAVWVVNGLDGTISRIDPQRDVVTDTLPVGDGPIDLAFAGGRLWVAIEHAGTLIEVDPLRRRILRTVRPGGRPQTLTAAKGRLLVGVAPNGVQHRGGTLRLLTEEPGFDSLDPAILVNTSPAHLLGLTNDGLVTLDHAGGSAGVQVVPDLATALPTPGDGATTYAFKVRPGIRYSDGRPVRARDFRYAIERLFRLRSPGVPFYAGIVGSRACRAHPHSCRLTRGIVTDDRTRRVTFHLDASDPDFLAKLAQPYAFAVPDGSAPYEATRTPLPATGPYRIVRYRPGRDLELVRNRRFREWSRAAQPDGYPDVIVWRFGSPLHASLTAIERGRADWVRNRGPLPDDRRREILLRHAGQVHVNRVPETVYAVMNTREPPFDDVRVRRALNLALDRRAFARFFDGVPTCQVVPAQMPGHSPYCPYTRNATPRGVWTAPDLAKARHLVAASHTKGMRVRVLDAVRSPPLDALVALLRDLGYRASVRLAPGRAYNRVAPDSRNHVQIASGGWGTDYPAASDFFDIKLSCRALRLASPLNTNDSLFCDRHIEAEADRARRRALTDPAAAERLWEHVYRDVVDQAPWLFAATPRYTDLVSKRAGNYQFHPLWGLLVDQLWVR